MNSTGSAGIMDILARSGRDLVDDWVKEQLSALSRRKDLLSESDMRRESAEFMALLAAAVGGGNLTDIAAAEWASTRDFLSGISRSRATKGFTPTETATFVFSLKQPLFARIQAKVGTDAAALASELWSATVLLDTLGLFTFETFV